MELADTFEWRGRRIACGRAGSGPPVVFCHGTPWSSWVWQSFAGTLARDFTVHLWDMPGYGHSSKDADHPVDFGTQAEAFVALLENWGLERPHVVAHDFGGAVSLRASLVGGAAYASLLLVDVVAIPPSGSPFFRFVGEHPDLLGELPGYIHEAIVRTYIQGASHRGLRDADLDTLVQPWLGEQGEPAFYRQIADYDEHYLAENERRLGQLDLPVRVLWGAEDAWIPTDTGERVASLIRGASFSIVAGAGHLVHYDAPVALADELRVWLSTHAGADREARRRAFPPRRAAAVGSVAPEPVADAVLDDLRARLRATRRPVLPVGFGWERGTAPEYLAGLVEEWAERYDWRVHEARIRALPWVQTTGLRLVHQRVDVDAPTVVLLHGWPDSVLRFDRVLPLLDDVNVVLPAYPGYPFSAPAEAATETAIADTVAAALAELGVDQYVISGGDIGASVAAAAAERHAAHVAALHLTNVPFAHIGDGVPDDLSDDERAYLAAVDRWQRDEGAYMHLQSTKPHTLAAALDDSPAGLLAWILEKLRSWSDCGGDVESVYSREEILTWVTAYWVTGTIGTALSTYVGTWVPPGRIDVPTVVTLFPADLTLAPREWAERFYDLRAYGVNPDGGHFTAWERPEAYVAGLKAAVDLA